MIKLHLTINEARKVMALLKDTCADEALASVHDRLAACLPERDNSTPKVTRICAGHYEVTGQGPREPRAVIVTHRADLKGWMAIAQWTNDTYTDIVPTYADAVREAINMIADA